MPALMPAFKRSSSSGQSIVETVVGIMFLIPVTLLLLDLAVVVIANCSNDNLAKTAARSAAGAIDPTSTQGTAESGYQAAIASTGSFAESSLIKRKNGNSFITGYCWNGFGTPEEKGQWKSSIPSVGNVGVITSMKVSLPVPFLFLPASFDFNAQSEEPIVSLAAGATAPTGPNNKAGSP